MRYRVMLLGVAVPALMLAQQPEQPMPRFRAGANLVRVDAYVSKDDVALTDLTAADFEVYEDDQPQRIENFELIEARAPVPANERPNASSTRDMRQQAADAARLFTLFFDRMYVSLSGSYHLQKPLIETLNKVIGPDDLVGAMTPELSPSAITYSRRTESIEQFVTAQWLWGVRDQKTVTTPQEDAINGCYDPNDRRQRGIAAEMIARLREGRTLEALHSLVSHLEGVKPERKFVIVFTEGWPLFEPSRSLTRTIDSPGPAPDPITVDPATGRIRPQGSTDPESGLALTAGACERLRLQLAQEDHRRDFLTLLQRANRANVSFYPVDARGLVVFDQPTNFDILPSDDQAGLRNRQNSLHDMAAQTDGYAIVNAGNVAGALQKIFRDVGSYYLLSYYSTNQRLDGRFRRIRVEVKRDGADVRARPGYLAPTEAEARAAGAAADRAAANAPPPTVARALDAIAPSRGNLPVRLQAAGARNSIRTIVELDAATVRQPEWMSGGTLRLTFEPERGAGTAAAAPAQTVTVAVEPGQRSISVNGGGQPLAAGRYFVRAELTARNSRLPLSASTVATVPADAAAIGTGALASRRGPSTGLAYLPTADPRFRRTERLRVEVPLMGEAISGSARLLTRQGHGTPLTVVFSTRVDAEARQQLAVADVTLAPLAEGEYVLELTLIKDGKSDIVSYGFRMIP